MVQIDVSTRLADVVDAHPQLAREFERRGLDYCCGGARTIAEACVPLGLDPAVTVDELAAAAQISEPAPWTTMTLVDLVGHLETTHHRYLWDEMPRVTALLEKIEGVHGGRHPELSETSHCFALVRADLEPHMLREERVLFPMIRELETSSDVPAFHCGTLRNPISVMLSEHDAVGELFARLRLLTKGYAPPSDGCASYVACFAALAEMEADTHLHIHKENNVLFPKVLQVEAERSRSGSR